MRKFLFLDSQELEWLRGFTRELTPPVKHAGNPVMLADAPWETGGMQLYGSVIKVPDRPFQLWYHTTSEGVSHLAYAESEDGVSWRKPELGLIPWQGRPTNLLSTRPHGTAVLYDYAEPREDWRYKMVTGAPPSNCICAFRSADGIRWVPVRRGPIIGTNPDCPMAFLRATDGRYVVYHRVWGFGRRIFRSESWDFVHWSGEPRLVVEPDAGDAPQTQFYGLGAAVYGPYELGTLWLYHTAEDDLQVHKMIGRQEPELSYARSGHAWHRAAQGTPFIPHGQKGQWDSGNLQCASAPVYLPGEIRYYYASTTLTHARGWTVAAQRGGLGFASLQPDRYVALRAGSDPAELMTTIFPFPSGDPALHVNAVSGLGGWVRAALLRADATPIEGMSEAECGPLTGDAVIHRFRWTSIQQGAVAPGEPVRLRLRAQEACVYALFLADPEQRVPYHQFAEPNPSRTHLAA